MASLPLSPFRRAAAEEVGRTLGMDPASFPVSTPPDPALGDYAVGCFPAAKALRMGPPQLAQKVVAAFQPTALLTGAKAAGPYVNFTIDRAALYRHLFAATLGATAKPIPTSVGEGRTVCVDFSSPNIAKPLSYHHIRSTVIGNALCRMHRALGYRVIGINHLGDWGTTFGKILAAFERWGVPEPLTIAAINDLYVRVRAEEKTDPALEQAGRGWFKRLEDSDPTARALWRRVKDISWREFQEVYDRLGIRFDEIRGESEYEAAMPAVIALLADKGLTSISHDALIVDLSADGFEAPMLLRKNDGATLYATRDLAAAIYRWETYGFARSLYVVGQEQRDHFAQLKLVLKKAGYGWADLMEHVPFGLVRIGGQKSGTRTGNVVGLMDVLDEAEERIAATIAELNADMPPERRQAVARDVGVGAIVFANLASQREKDVDFELDRVLSFEGDAGPYVQYAHARTASILRRGGALSAAEAISSLGAADPERLVRDEEWALAAKLCDIGDETARATHSLEPHTIARYLLDVCAAFSRWYTLGNQDPTLKVLTADEATTRARLALTAATRETLRVGLDLLGIAAPDEM